LLDDKLNFLVHFKSLLRLELVFCRISDVELASLSMIFNDATHPHPLQTLNLSHNLITDLTPIRNLLHIRELHIGQNRLTSLDVVRNLSALTVLDFHDNLIEDLSPIVHCTQLTIVRGGKNRVHSISAIADDVAKLKCLELLNLSANKLLYYSEIDVLAALPKLRQLELNDPHFGANPICALSNYHIYALFKLRQIESLDGIHIDAHSKQKAQISMYKKTMFYQILYDCAQRDATAFERLMHKTGVKLQRTLLEHTLFAFEYNAVHDADDEAERERLSAVDERLREYEALCAAMWSDIETIKARADKQTENKFEVLRQELRTAGNLRLLECNNDADYARIDELIEHKVRESKARSNNGKEENESDADGNIHILNAMKIDHKFSEYAFRRYTTKHRQRLSMQQDTWASDVQPCNADFSRSQSRKRENSRKEKAKTNGKESTPTPLEMDRVFVMDEFASTDSTEILASVLSWKDVEKPIRVKSTTTIDENDGHKMLLFVEAFFSSADPPEEYEGVVEKVGANTADDEEEKYAADEWLIGGSYQLLPLYIVQVCRGAADSVDVMDAKSVDIEDEWDAAVRRVLSTQSLDFVKNNMSALLQFLYTDFAVRWRPTLTAFLRSNAVLAALMESDEQPMLTSRNLRTDDAMTVIHCTNEQVETALRERAAEDAECFRSISICFTKNDDGELSFLTLLADFAQLSALDLSFNGLKSIPNIFESLPRLCALSLAGNDIVLLNELTLLKFLTLLTELDLRGNSIVWGKGFRNLCVNIVPSLVVLNGADLDSVDAAEAECESTSPTQRQHFEDLLRRHSYSKIQTSIFEEDGDSRIPFDVEVGSLGTALNGAVLDTARIIHLNLSGCRLLFVPPMLAELVNLESLDLSDNFLLQIKGVAPLCKLKELSVRNNNLSSLASLSGLSCSESLRKLDVGCNRIAELASIDSYCPALKVFSFESNEVSDLSALRSMTNLIQISAAYNRIHSSDSVYTLSFALRSVAILDLKGNALCAALPHYRLFVIFCLKRSLRMLDGASITSRDIERADALLAGKLHYDLLVNKVGHKYFGKVHVLELSDCGLRGLGGGGGDYAALESALNARSFGVLKELVLSHNELSEIDALLSLATLCHLDVSHNWLCRVDAPGLARLRLLERLDVSHNRVEAISELGLSGLHRLHFLALSHNRIVHLDGLADLPRLETLQLDCNKIRKLSRDALSPLTHTLTELSVRSNGMRSLECLEVLEELKVLDIASNRLNHVHQLNALKPLHALFQLTLDANPVMANHSAQCLEHICKVAPSLKFVGHLELAELRTELKLKAMLNNPQNREAYLQPPNIYSHHNAGADADRDSNLSDHSAASAASTKSLSHLLPMQNPLGLKIQSVQKYKSRQYRK